MSTPERIAICPGSFDPITLGHEDIIVRALRLADRVGVAIAHSPSQEKRGLFSVEERMEIIREVFSEEPRLQVESFSGLMVDFARKAGATLCVRGLRSGADLDYELPMSRMNSALDSSVETVFLASSPETSFVSASLVREVHGLGGDVSGFVSPAVLERLRKRG